MAMVCVLTPVQVTPSADTEPMMVLPNRSQRTQYGKGEEAEPATVVAAFAPVSTRYSTVTGEAEAGLSVTGTLTVPLFSGHAALFAEKPTTLEGDSSSLRYSRAGTPRPYGPGA